MREFLFKFRNNQLMTNYRLNSFDNSTSPYCTFCRIIGRANTDETFRHLFFECNTTQQLLLNFILLLEPVPDINSVFFAEAYWYGKYSDNTLWEESILLVFDCFRFVIWKYKLRRKVPNWPTVLRELHFILETIFSLNKRIKYIASSANIIANLLPARG